MLAHLAGFIYRRRRWVLAATALFMVVAIGLGINAFGKLKSGGFDDPASDSTRAADIVNTRFGGSPNLILLVSPRAAGGDVQDPQVAAAGQALSNRFAAEPGVGGVVSWWGTRAPGLLSHDGREALIAGHVLGDSEVAGARAKQLITELAVDTSVLSVHAGGELGVNTDIGGQVGKDLAVAESIAVPLTLLLLVLAFGSVTAALLPMGIGALAVFATFAELFLIGSVTDVSIFAINLTTGLGLGLAIDYSLLMVSRFREELAAGRSIEAALTRTMTTAGRTIIFSSLTVAAALAAMLAFPLYFLRSFAYAGIGVVLIALLGAVVALPAVLASLGPRVNSGRIRRSRPLRSASEESPIWRRIATGVMRRPLRSAAPVIVLLLALGIPFLHVGFATPDDRVLQPAAGSRQVGDALRSSFGADGSSALIAVVQGAPGAQATAAYAAELSGLASVRRVESIAGSFAGGRPLAGPAPADKRFAAGDIEYLSVQGPADSMSTAAQQLVGDVRAVPAPAGAHVLVGGPAAQLVDGKQAIAGALPLAGGLIVLTTLVLLFLFTGSVLLPFKALLLNVLSLTGVFGAMVWMFQDGHGSGLLGFTPGPINTSMPVLLFCIAFGLSMDYEVFLLGRIKEQRDHGAGNEEAVAGGLARTGRIVSTAAALLAVTFLAFSTSKVSFIQLFGIGTAIAILMDATLIRGVLVPAFMRLAGGANWWAPAPLRRLHNRIGMSET